MNAISMGIVMTAALGISALGSTDIYDIEADFDLSFLGAERREKCDLYRPIPRNEKERFPGIVIIHGGGWSGGSKSASREINIGTNLARMGYVCISIDYVLATREKPSWPENIYDCKRGVQFLRVNAARWQLDSDHIGCIGGSAGGHLSAFLATAGPDAGLEPQTPYPGVSSQVQAAVNLYGIADLEHWRNTAPDGTPLETFKLSSSVRMLGRTLEEDPALWRQASPFHQADAGDPPIFTLHGRIDTTVDYQQSIDFAARLTELGVENELMMLDNIGHTFDLQSWGSKQLDEDVRRRILSFFDRHLKGLTAAETEARFERLKAWEAVHPEAAPAGMCSLSKTTISRQNGENTLTVERNGFPLDIEVIPATRFVLQSSAKVDDLEDDLLVSVTGTREEEEAFRVKELVAYAPDTTVRSLVRDDLLRGRLEKRNGDWIVRAGGKNVMLQFTGEETIARRRESRAQECRQGDTLVYGNCRQIGALLVADRIVFSQNGEGK